MRVVLEILQFELRQQLKSPFLLATLLLFFLIHFLSITSTGISLWAHPQAHINSAYAIAVVETTLTVFGMLPVIAFVANAVLRDHDTQTVELFFVKPIGKSHYLWGRFGAACLLAALLGLAGLLGSLTGTLMPWLDQQRLAAFSLQPFLLCFFWIVLPNMLILCALFFSVASLTRSLAATVALALVFMVGDLLLANVALNGNDGPGALALADYSATLAIDAASRNLTVAELNTLFPQALLFKNRLLWLVMALAVLLVSVAWFRLTVVGPGFAHRLRRQKAVTRNAPATPPAQATTRADQRTSMPTAGSAGTQLRSQLRMDLSFVLRSPLFLLVLVLGVISTVSDYSTHVSPVMNSPLHPVTSSMLDFFRFGLMPFILVIAIYYSGTLVDRERASGIAEMVGASPMPDWILPLSKTLALCAVVTLLLTVVMLTAITLQALSGYTHFELGLYLRAVFVYNGFYYWMLCVLAVTVQIVVANKWLGMLLVLALNVVLLSLEAFGFEHILYRFAIPHVVYSDMNGFGYVSRQVYALIGYWGCFCALLILLGHLLYPRGVYAPCGERVRNARARLSRPVVATMVLFVVCFVAAGSWIFYNTNVLNAYRTSRDLQQLQAAYERAYGHYENRPAPSFSDIDMAIDLFPEERRLESRGTATLTNNKRSSITEFVVSVDPRMQVHELRIDAASLTTADAAQGFFLFQPDTPIEPGATTTMTWTMSRMSRGFATANHDTEVVENGTFVTSQTVIPMPGFDETRKLTDNAVRRKFGLEAAPRLPALGEAQYLDKLMYGVDRRADFRIVMSTAADQIAVAPGRLEREWRKDGRRYFEYSAERPTWPAFYLMSARYEMARDTWSDGKQDVGLEVYYHPRHAYNVEAMLATTKRSLDYFTRAFAPYPYSHFRIMEYPRYRMAARANPGGGVAYSEAVGWITDLSTLHDIDYTTIHELSHMWWGDQAPGAKMQGREVLHETLAQYSVLMVYKHYDDQNAGPDLVNRITSDLQSAYLQARSQDTRQEHPVMYTDDQAYVSYGKGALALYVFQELIGEEAVNRALRNYLARFAFKPAPFATSRDLVHELRAVSGPAYQDVITDLFEKIVLYDVQLTDASAVQVGDSYEVALTLSARQFEADGLGAETEVPLHTWFDIGLFPDAQQAPEKQAPLYLKKHLLKSGTNTITFDVAEKPAYASVDPFRKMADRWPDNNGQVVEYR